MTNGMDRLTLIAVLALAAAGCRATAQVKEVPRVDLQVSESDGNRGYFLGSPPPLGARQSTRQMVEVIVETPGLSSAEGEAISAPMASAAENAGWKHVKTEPSGQEWMAPESFDLYTVQEGDSLWSIAADPKHFGKATAWRMIFDANRDRMKAPDDLHAGLELRIPHTDPSEIQEAVRYGK